jgi:hypothetical protein
MTTADQIETRRAAAREVGCCQECLRLLRSGAASWAGTLSVVVARTAVADTCGDVLVTGGLLNRWARVSAFGHEVLHGGPPVGRALLREEGDLIVACVYYDDSAVGRRAAAWAIEHRGDWSIGFTYKWRDATPRDRGLVIRRYVVDEVSPVERGAGIRTGQVALCLGCCDETGSARRQAILDQLLARGGDEG